MRRSNFLMKNKRGEILIENVVFILLNLAFLAILFLFLLKQGQGVILWEESSAKQIALLIDASPANTFLTINMQKPLKVAKKKGIDLNNIIKVNGNIVTVKLSEDSGYDYSFFNDVNV